MRYIETSFDGVGGVSIFACAWLPDEEPHACVVIAHGAAEHSGRYAELARRLVSQGYAVHALDHRGHGRSQGRRGNIERFEFLLRDLDTYLAQVREQHPGPPLILLGHSMGGAIACSYAVRHPGELQGLALSAPALGAGVILPRMQRLLIRVLSALAPNVGVLKLPAAAISRDPAVVLDYEQDPLVYRGAMPARTVAELLAAMAAIPDGVAGLRLPVLIQHGTADQLAELAVMRPIYARIASADKTILSYEGLYHEIFNEPERDRVIGDLEHWLARFKETPGRATH